MKTILLVLFLFASNLSFASTIQVERAWKEVTCKKLAETNDVKRFDLEYCVDNSAVSVGYEYYNNQEVPFNFKGYLYANSVKENCDGVVLLDQSGHLVKILDIVCDL
jgi:hypothetical protein